MIIELLSAFLICGLFCLLGQIILNHSKLTPGHVTSIFVVLGSILEFFNIYEHIRNIGNIGASLPIVSFGSLIMKGVKDSIDLNGFIGIFKGVFDNCGTLISFSIFLAFLSTIFFKPKS